jgi:hypothetical protein
MGKAWEALRWISESQLSLSVSPAPLTTPSCLIRTSSLIPPHQSLLRREFPWFQSPFIIHPSSFTVSQVILQTVLLSCFFAILVYSIRWMQRRFYQINTRIHQSDNCNVQYSLKAWCQPLQHF